MRNVTPWPWEPSKYGVAVYSQVVRDREARNALPPKRIRRPGGGGGSKPKVRDWPWEVKGHRIHALAEAHWRCEHCRKEARTKTSLATLGKRPCHRGTALTPSERNARSQLSKWHTRAAAACGRIPEGVLPPVTHRPQRLDASWKCTLCLQEERTLGDLGIFCRQAHAAAGGRPAPPPASQDIRRFFAPVVRPPGRPPDQEVLE